MDPKLRNELEVLLVGALELQNTSEQTERLNEILSSSSEAIDICVEFYSLVAILKSSSILSEVFQKADHAGNLSIELLKQIANDEELAPAIEMPKQESETKVAPKIIKKPKEERPVVKKFFRLYNTLVYAAAVFFVAFIVYTQMIPNKICEPVGVVVDQINTIWGNDSENLNNNDKVRTNFGLLDLERGIVSIEFDVGVEAVIEGPALFEIAQSGVFLEYGRLYSRVSPTGTGFTVKTPNSQFVDHGTEFGVRVERGGISELHVTKGKVELFGGTKGPIRVSQMVYENNAAQFDTDSGKIRNIPIQKGGFVRKINSAINYISRGENYLETFNTIHFVDAGLDNTTINGMVPSEGVNYTTSSDYGVEDDGLWHYRDVGYLGYDDYLWEAYSGESCEPLIVSMILPTPGRYRIYVLASLRDIWDISVSVDGGSTYRTGNSSNSWYKGSYSVDGKYPITFAGKYMSIFTAGIVTTTKANQELQVYVDDYDSGISGDQRTNFDGLGYEYIPELAEFENVTE